MNRLQQDQEISIPGFPGRDFAKSRDPGIFRDGISLKFLSRDFTKKAWDLWGFPYQLINLVNFIHFGGHVCLQNTLHRQRSHPSHPVASSKSERVFSVAGNVVTQKRASLAPEKVEACVIVKSNLGLLRHMGMQSK